MCKVLYTPPAEHWHGSGLGMDRIGTFAMCDCGKLIIYRGSSSGMVKWWPATRREQRRYRRLVAKP